MRKVKVKPKSTKIRNKVKEHGEIWLSTAIWDGNKVQIQTLKPVHAGGHPYSVWVSKDDCDLEVV